MADDLSAQGSGLRARQTKRSPHAPENITPTPTVNLRVDIHFLAQGLEETGKFSLQRTLVSVRIPRGDTFSLSVGKDLY